MKFIKRISKLLVLLIVFSNANLCLADWVGPTTVVKGSWGRGLSQFALKKGIIKDKFPTKFHILPDNSILIEDLLNYRFKIFSIDGSYLNSISTMYEMSVLDQDRLAGFYWDTEILRARLGVYSISQKKWLWINKSRSYNFNSSIIEVANKKVFVWNSEENKGYNYSATGELIQTYTDWPLELGITTSGRSGPLYKTLITFDDEIYAVFAREPASADFRDDSSYLYDVKIFIDKSNERIKQVYKYDICGKEKGVLQFPLSTYESKPSAKGKLIPIAEYGDPIVSHTGDVYAWLRSSKEYKIVKWSWNEKPSTPSGGPDAPEKGRALPTTSGVFLTWNPAPQDPGCVEGYEIERSSSVDGKYKIVSVVPRNPELTYSLSDAVATSGSRWFYHIHSISDIGKTDFLEVNAALPQ